VEIVTIDQQHAWDGDYLDAEAAYTSVDALISGSMFTLLGELPRMTAMKWIHTFSIGVDHPGYQQVIDSGVTLTNGAGSQSMPIAQYVLLMMLHHVKGMASWERAQARRE